MTNETIQVVSMFLINSHLLLAMRYSITSQCMVVDQSTCLLGKFYFSFSSKCQLYPLMIFLLDNNFAYLVVIINIMRNLMKKFHDTTFLLQRGMRALVQQQDIFLIFTFPDKEIFFSFFSFRSKIKVFSKYLR